MLRSIFEVYPEQSAATMPLGICVDGLVYGRGLDGSNPLSGELPATAEVQMRLALSKARRLVEEAGGDASAIQKITAIHRCPEIAALFKEAWSEVFPGVDSPTFEEAGGHLAVGRLLELDCHATLPGSKEDEATIEPISACPDEVGGPSGARLGPIVYGRVTAMDPCSGALQGSNLVEQLWYALENMQTFLRYAGIGLDAVARATLFMNPPDLGVMNLVWSALYPDASDRPPHKWAPATLPEGQLAAVDVIAIPGVSRRRVIEIESAHHGDPMTMAAVTGTLVTSSRVIAHRIPDPAQYAHQIFDNIAEIMAEAGGSLESLTQLTAFIGQPEYRLLVEHELTQRLAIGASRPVVHYVEANLGGTQAPRIEILGVV